MGLPAAGHHAGHRDGWQADGQGHPVAAVDYAARAGAEHSHPRASSSARSAATRWRWPQHWRCLTSWTTSGSSTTRQRWGSYLGNRLRELAGSAPQIAEVRQIGLAIGVEIVRPGTVEPDAAGAKEIVEGMRERGVLIGTTGRHGNVLKIRPPLVFRREHADQLVAALLDTLADVPHEHRRTHRSEMGSQASFSGLWCRSRPKTTCRVGRSRGSMPPKHASRLSSSSGRPIFSRWCSTGTHFQAARRPALAAASATLVRPAELWRRSRLS